MSLSHLVLAVTTRGDRVEGEHAGSYVATDGDGAVIASAGHSSHETYFRSSAKMLQAISVVTSGAADRFGLDARELSLCCASHNGADYHVRGAEEILRKIGLSVGELRCGAHEPFDRDELLRLHRGVATLSALHNNCSGKHAGMLAACVASGWTHADYTAVDHPLQRDIRANVAGHAGLEAETIHVGVDGCSLPTFFLSLRDMSRAMAQWILRSESPTSPQSRIRAAIAEHPEMINGHGGFDTELARVTRGRLIAKRGAMAVFVVAAMDPMRGPVAITVKLASGDATAVPVVVMSVLVRLGLLRDEERTQLHAFERIVQRNWNGIETGAVESRLGGPS